MAHKLTFSIRTILVMGFGGLLVAGILSALYFGVSAAFQNTRDLLTEQAEDFVDNMVDEVQTRLGPVEVQANWIAGRVMDGRLDLRTVGRTRTTDVLDAIVAATPQVGAVAVISGTGILRQWTRDGGSVLIEDVSRNKPVMDWVRSGRRNFRQEWGPPFWLDTLETAVVLYQTALFDPQGYVGVLVLAVTLTDLSIHLSGISDHSFILVGQDGVLAHPLMINWRPLDEKTMPTADAIYQGRSALVPLSELGDPVLERIWTADYQELVVIRDMADTQAVAADIGDRQYVYLYRTIEGFGPEPWSIGTYLDTTTDDDVIQRLDRAMYAGLIVIVMAMGFSFFLARALGRPIRALARASEAVQRGELAISDPMPTSRVAELNRAMESFQGMIAGLAERDTIRQTLGRYVPEAIARQLLEEDGGLQPSEGEATILFSDIAGFTALTEKLGPGRIVEVLNAYFSRMTGIIETRHGVITQFQGDAILAIFNIPLDLKNHADHACHAAMEMQTAIETETFAGERLAMRIGINTGMVVAGAVGAEDRLTYTVHGDAVNRAARVEAMNKELGTKILVSETTRELLQEITVCEVGVLDVRGQSSTVTVYTIEAQNS